MHSRSNSSAEATIKRVQGPQVDLPWGHIRGVLKGQSQNQNLPRRQAFRPASRKGGYQFWVP